MVINTSTGISQQWMKLTPQFSTGDTSFYNAEGVFVTKDVGWFVGSAYNEIGEKRGKLFRTSDGGNTWQLRKDIQGVFTMLFGLDEWSCWVRNLDRIYFTTDGGYVWDSSRVDIGFVDAGSDPLYFFNEREGFAFGSRLFLTTDCGKNWMIQNEKDSLLTRSTGDVAFTSRTRGWIIGDFPYSTDAGFIAATTDGGENWQFQFSPLGTYPLSGY